MKIGRLELVGFKSFKDRTLVQFDRGVTGIVGPNGCGKSNIIDAFLWVMGEMSAKHLRGGVMEDVIFSGAQGYAPSGFAEVSIVLENEGSCFPGPWAKLPEVMITRRLHRSGESEYLMNKQACRLRDVQEFFMDVGAGRRGFSIVAQEAISRLVLAKPEERRVFIEEAAGISKFKLRQKESQRKLAATDANLLRLNDILAEQKRQLASLQRQAKKAEKYRQIKIELQQKDLWLMSIELLDLQRQRRTAGQALEGAKAQAQALEAQLAEHENRVQASKATLSEKEDMLRQQQQRSAQASERVREGEKQARELEFQLQQAEENKLSATQVIEQNEAKKAKVVADTQALRLEKKQLDEHIQKTKSQSMALQSTLDSLKDQLDELEQKHQQGQHERTQNLQKQSETGALKEGVQQQLTEAQEQEQVLDRELVVLNKTTQKLTHSVKQLEDKLAQEQQYQMDLSHDAEQSKSHLSQLQTDKSARVQELAELKDAFHQSASQLEGLEKLQASFEGLQEGSKNIMMLQKSQSQEQTLSGATPLADVVEVPALYELAAEAFLGSRLQSLLTQQPQQACEMLQMLKKKNLGRSSFVTPLATSEDRDDKNATGELATSEASDDKNATGDTATSEAGGGGDVSHAALASSGVGARDKVAADLPSLAAIVKVKDPYRDLVLPLLQDAFVVDTLDQAMQLQQQHPGCSFVSLEGEGVFRDGVMVGGTAEAADSGSLRRRREMRELRLQKTELEGKLALAKTALQQLQGEEDELNETHETHKHTAHKKELVVAGLKKDVDFELAQIQKHTDLCQKTQQQLQQSRELIQSLKQQLDELQQLQQRLMDEGAELASSLKASEQGQVDLRQRYEGQQKDLTELQIQHAGLKEKHEALYLQIKLLEEQVADNIQQIEVARATVKQSEQILEHSGQRHQEQKINLEQWVGEAEKEQLASSRVADDVQQLLEDGRKLDAQVADHLRRIGDHKTAVSQAQARTEKFDLKMDHLVQQAAEKYTSRLLDESQKYLDVEVEAEELEATRRLVQELSDKLSRVGGVHLGAIEEHDELLKRHEFLAAQCEDLQKSKLELVRVIEKIRRTYSKRFNETFELVNERFSKVFVNLFAGGRANLIKVENEEKKELGIDIMAQPPGKKLQSISLLSGGEKALTAVALIFSIFLVNPSPFCLLDEVDAPLDDANVDRFNELVKEMAKLAQIIVVTHNKNTMRVNNKLFGVTMQERGVSKLVSVSLQS